ncbi:MAG TPA: glycosyltransferase [Acidimicrobiales bacterium]|nr:glycosyltransferase [Acidimicrobiales bacterium]
MTPARVLHILGAADRSSTGIATIVSQLAAGIDVERYALEAWFTGGDGPLVADVEKSGAVVRVVPWTGARNDPLGSLGFWRQLRRERFSIAHFHVGGTSMVSLVRQATGAKVVVHLHGTAQEHRGARVPIHTARLADAVIAASSAVAAAVPRADVTVAYAAVAISTSPSAAAISGPIVGTAGRLVPVKRVERLLEAFRLVADRLPEARLEIAGDGPRRAGLVSYASELGLGDKVTFLGWVEDLPSVFRRWRAFAATSESEGLNLALAQAMGAGLPAVATNVGGMREVIQDDRGGWLVDPDAQVIAERLTALLVDPTLAQDMGNIAREHIRRRFSTERFLTAVTAVYNRLS